MADYNIYIHSDNANGPSSPTQPWSSSGGWFQGMSWDSGSQAKAQTIQAATNVAANPDGLVTYGIAAFAKAIPWIAAAYAVLKLAEQVTSAAISFYGPATGDYKSSVEFSNFETKKGWLLQPFSTLVNHRRTLIEIENENAKRYEQRLLLGDSVINSYSNRGV